MKMFCGPQGKKGSTLVELVVGMLLFSMMLLLVIGVLGPAAKVFVRMQRLQFAQAVLDNTIQELQGMAEKAVGYVKIYESCKASDDMTAKEGADQGYALEFVNTDGYVTLISTEGCPDTEIYLGDMQIDTVKAEEIGTGRLLSRYYLRESDGKYRCENGAGAVARAVSGAFADGYYMGNYLEIMFSYPAGVGEGGKAGWLNAEVRLYSDKEKTQLTARDSAVLEFRYEVKRQDEITAKRETP